MEDLFCTIGASRLEDVYVFGSWLQSELPNDIDLLVLFDPQHSTIEEALVLRCQIAEAVEAAFGLTADIVLLSFLEEQEVDFIDTENCEPFMDAVRARCDFPSG